MSPSTLVQVCLMIIGGLGILGCEPNEDSQLHSLSVNEYIPQPPPTSKPAISLISRNEASFEFLLLGTINPNTCHGRGFPSLSKKTWRTHSPNR